jgi:hypothetical protein
VLVGTGPELRSLLTPIPQRVILRAEIPELHCVRHTVEGYSVAANWWVCLLSNFVERICTNCFVARCSNALRRKQTTQQNGLQHAPVHAILQAHAVCVGVVDLVCFHDLAFRVCMCGCAEVFLYGVCVSQPQAHLQIPRFKTEVWDPTHVLEAPTH